MMFTTNPFSHLASSTHVFPPSNPNLDQEKHDLYNHLTNNPFQLANENKFKQDLGVDGLLGFEKKKKGSMKDHHSKIHTSKGPRDRRVRLSIEVARKFFCLQDLLGFDKASKTLDWLFNKSQIPIDELVKSNKQTSSSDQSEVVFLEKVKDGSTEVVKVQKGQKRKPSSRVDEKRSYKSGSPMNQSTRAEARARARERTREKLNIKNIDSCSSDNLTQQSSYWSSIESQNDKIGMSIMDDNVSMLYTYQHKLVVSNESSSLLPEFNVVLEPQGELATI